MNRTQLAAQIDDLDRQIKDLQEEKRTYFEAYREAYGKAECKAAKIAIRRRQKLAAGDREEIQEIDALADEIFIEITGTPSRAAHERAAA